MHMTVSRGTIRRNLAKIRQMTAVPVTAVVKHNAYGMGLIPFAGALAQNGVTQFAVSRFDEAMTLWEAGHRQVLLIAPVWEASHLRLLAARDIAVSLAGEEHLRAVESALEGRPLRVQLALDSGMHRFGFTPEEAGRLCLPQNLRLEGCYTHFAAPWQKKTTLRQHARFTRMLDGLRQAGIDPGTAHCCATQAFWRYPQLHMDGVRLGSALVGACPGLEPVWRLEAPVCAVKQVPAGESVGYGTHRLHRPTRAAILSVGHCDGLLLQRWAASPLRRLLQDAPLKVMWRGNALPLLGGAGSGHLAVDATDLPLACGDRVQLVTSPLLLPETVKRIYEP